MIKIIEWVTKTIGECGNCGCRFSYENEDIERENGPVQYKSEYVVCPQCGKKLYITRVR